MFLLAHTLGVDIRVFRVAHHNQSDFVTHFNDESKGLPMINIVTENDKHYNIVSA